MWLTTSEHIAHMLITFYINAGCWVLAAVLSFTLPLSFVLMENSLQRAVFVADKGYYLS